MDFLAGICTSIAGEIAKYTIVPIGRHLGYLFHYQSNIENLKNQMKGLEDMKKSIDHQVEEAQRKGEETEGYVKNWISEVERKIDEAKDILMDEGHKNAMFSCNIGSFPNLVSRHQLSRKAQKMAQMIVSETQKAYAFGRISYHPILKSSYENKGFQAFDTTILAMKKIMQALKDPDLSLIGVYGGVGKTTLVKEIACKAQEEESFSEVIMVTVSKTYDLKNVQKEIAEKLGLELSEESMSTTANRLQHRFRQEQKNILIILDDIWEKINLEDAGIYFKVDQRGSKILLVSRDRDVLRNLMGVEKDFKLEVLAFSEAMNLFENFVGDVIGKTGFKRLATDIVRECGGLPIAIVTIACALKNKDIFVWENASQRMKKAPREVYGKAYWSIKTSYDFLESEEKSIFLLCSLHKEDSNIYVENLMMIYAASCNLFRDVDTLVEARNLVRTLVDKLKAHCLLLEGDYHDTVKMHDVIRDISMSIASEHEHMYCFTNVDKFERWLNDGKLKDSTAISLLGFENCIQLPEQLGCPMLKLLLMSEINKSLHYHPMLIPSNCFEEATELRALCLDRVHLRSLPSSFCSLQNVQTLCLRGCDLEPVALIGELKNLIILDLSRSSLVQLPKQIGKLTRLRMLNLNACSSLKVIQPNVLSSLVHLEELYMSGVFMKWESKGVNGERNNASLTELKNLPRLNTLRMRILLVFLP